MALVFVALVLLNLAAAVVLALRKDEVTANPAFAKAFAIAYPELDQDDRERLQAESVHRFDPAVFAQPRERPMEGRFVRIDKHGFRRGTEQRDWPPAADDFTVFLFGGSTTFGYGVRDQDTIGSALQSSLAKVLPGRRVALYNFGRGGYYSTQERVLFDELLTLGYRPRLAVFVDGLNEFSLQNEPPVFTKFMSETAADDLAYPLRSIVRGSPLIRLLDPNADETRFADHVKAGMDAVERPPGLLVDDLVERYLANRRIIAALGDAYGVTTVFVWQPIPTYKYDLAAHPAWQGLLGELHARGYDRLAARTEDRDDPRSIWCADIQEGRAEAFYVDEVHYNPRMSTLLAECIVDALVGRRTLAAAGEARPGPVARLAANAGGSPSAAPGVTGDASSLPPGSYRASCEGCSLDGALLRCDCRDRAGRSRQTSASCPGGYANLDGRLVCE